MAKISIIIPVYNNSQYLHECLDSVCCQTIQDIQIICINDGSTDDSLQVLKEFAEKNSRITIIDQKNQGVSAARNAGLKIAQGKFVGFVDSDDTIEKDFFLKLFHVAEQSGADSVYSRLSLGHHFGVFKNGIDRQEIIQDLLPQFLRQDNFNSVCVKIFRLEIISEHQIRFPLGIPHGEDAQFNIEFLMKARRISLLDYCGYYYREVEGSATRNIAKHDYLKRIIEVYETDWTPIIGNSLDRKQIENLKKIRFANAVISLVYIYGNRGNDFKDAQRFSKLRDIVQHPTVKNVFSDLQILAKLKLGKYPATIFSHIRKQNVLMLYLLTQYSYYRNR